MVNPYIAGAPVTEAKMFFGREDVFQWIENSIAGQYADHILVIHGQRRVGKTSVLKQLGNRLPKRFIPVFFDLQGRTHTTLDRFLWWLAREIVRVLKQERGIDIPLPDKDAFAADIEFFEHRFLPELKPVLGTNTLLLTFDEFDNLEESEIKEELARPLIDYLRRLMGNGGLNFIFSIGSSGRKLENMQAAYTEFFKTALYKKISFLNEDQTRGLITRPVEDLIEYDRHAVTRIFQVAGGHPYFTQLTCHELFAKCQRTEQRSIHEDDVESILDDVVERGTVNLKFVWDEASDIEKWGLAALAQLEKTDNRSLTDFLRKNRVRFSETDLTSGLLHLREKDILTRDNRFVIQYLKLWLQKNRPMEQAREELTEVNPIANRYIEIGLEFKDAGIYEKAIESFKEALAVAKDNIQAQVNIALTYMDQKLYSSAVVEFEKALAMDDEEVSARAGLCEAHLALGDVAIQKGRAKEAAQSYQRVLAINAEHTEARQRMSELARQRAEKALIDGKDEEALSAFGEALKYTPEDPALTTRVDQVRAEKKARVLATLLARSEKEASAKTWEKAIATLNEALVIAPADESILQKIETVKERQLKDRLEAILLKADQAEKSNRWDVAIAALKEYLSLQPGDTRIQKRLADLIEARHTAWLKAILTRAEQAAASQKWDEAFSALNEVLSLEPENEQVRKKMDELRATQRTARLEAILKQAEQAAQAGKWDEAISVLKNGIAFAPEDGRLKARLAQVTEAKRLERLKAGLRLAETAAASGKWNVAIQSLNELLAVEPDNVEVQRKLAEIQKRQRESKLDALRNQARALARAERFDEALSAWQEYLALEPDDRAAAETEIETVKNLRALALAYVEAQNAYAKKNYDHAVSLLKGIINQDENYKDASRLLAESIELRRTAPKWWQSKLLWSGLTGLFVLIVAWLAFRFGSPLMNALTASPSLLPTMTNEQAAPVSNDSLATATSIPTASPTPLVLPYRWARLSSGKFLPRDSITAIVVDPNDAGVIYVGTQNAGVYKSIDGGTSWQPIHNGLGRASIDTLIVDAHDPKILYTGTLLGGVYKTSDGGMTWQAQNTGLGNIQTEWVSIVVMDAQESQHLYFTSSDNIFETISGGQSWHPTKDESTCPNHIVGLAVDPTDGKVLYAAEFGGEFSGCQSGIYRSADAGETWEISSTGLDTSNIQWNSLVINPVDGKILFVTSAHKLWVSKDAGETWTESLALECSAVAFDTKDSQTAYCGDENKILKTTDGGTQWDMISEHEHGWSSAMLVSPHDSNQIFWGAAGLYLSADGGRSWNEYNSGLGAYGFELKAHPANSSLLYAQVGTSTIFLSEDQGETWKDFAAGQSLVFDQKGETTVILDEANDLGVSKDGGGSWQQVMLPSKDNKVYAVAIHPAITDRVFALYGRNNPPYIYYSSDLGQTWQDTNGMRSVHNPRLFFDHDQGNRVYAVGDLDIFRSDDGGLTWESCGNYSDSLWASFADMRAVVDWGNPNQILIATRGNGILISKDGCKSWNSINAGLGSFFVNTIAMDPNNTMMLYAATEGGAYVSTDGGASWGQVNEGLLGATVVYSIVVDRDSNAYAATPYGIFQLEEK